MLLIAVVTGCARDPVVPPSNYDEQPALSGSSDVWEGPYRLWGEWDLLINDTHERIDVVPRRQGRFHLNALKFLESYCSDCLKITGLKNNGDGTIDLTVQITHPFPGMPQYTGFDVKGIIMFNGSHEIVNYYGDQTLPKFPLWPDSYHVSWERMGDPELLNADGYTWRWSPSYDSGSSMPIFNYWEGKYAHGIPTANINGYKDFFTNSDRHMFETGKQASATYHVWLPPGPVTAGYAVEACWEPPINTPVTNPAEDFPITANQPEAYHFKLVVNEGKTITDPNCCNVVLPFTCEQAHSERNIWYYPPGYEEHDGWWVGSWTTEFGYQPLGFNQGGECDGHPDWGRQCGKQFSDEPDGFYQLIAFEWHVWVPKPDLPIPFIAVDIFEVEIDCD
jgi:hypothetical protein